MNWLIRFALPLSLALATYGDTRDTGLKITIHVYNYAGVPDRALDSAKREAARIYRQAGVETEWVDCPLSPAEAGLYPACNLPPGPVRLSLRFVSQNMAAKVKLSKMAVGYAWLPSDGTHGFLASVCAHRGEELAKKKAGPFGVILGHLAAHELGHLLLGIGSHAPSGIMHVPWYPKELALMRQGGFYFSSWQAKRIRSQVRERLARTSVPPSVGRSSR